MALVNFVNDTSVTRSLMYTNPVNPIYYGSEPNVRDGDVTTYAGIRSDHSGDGQDATCAIGYQAAWTTPRRIDSLFIKLWTYSWAYSGNYASGTSNQLVQLQINGVWTTIFSWSSGSPNTSFTTATTWTGPWYNVTGVNVYGYAAAGAYQGQDQTTSWVYLYEVDALTNIYGNIGFYVETPTAIQHIGCDPLTSVHTLRITKGGTTYGIPLLSTSDVDASSVRIAKAGVIYALPKATS